MEYIDVMDYLAFQTKDFDVCYSHFIGRIG